jgi:hypothetical protein
MRTKCFWNNNAARGKELEGDVSHEIYATRIIAVTVVASASHATKMSGYVWRKLGVSEMNTDAILLVLSASLEDNYFFRFHWRKASSSLRVAIGITFKDDF